MLNIGEFINKVMFHYHKDGNFLWKVRDDGIIVSKIDLLNYVYRGSREVDNPHARYVTRNPIEGILYGRN